MPYFLEPRSKIQRISLRKWRKADFYLFSSLQKYTFLHVQWLCVSVCLCVMCMCRCVHAMVHVEIRGQHLKVSPLFPFYVGSGDWSQMVWIAQHTPHPLSITHALLYFLVDNYSSIFDFHFFHFLDYQLLFYLSMARKCCWIGFNKNKVILQKI